MATFEDATQVLDSTIAPTQEWNQWLNTRDEVGASPRNTTVYGVGIKIGKLAFNNSDVYQQPDAIAERFAGVTIPEFGTGEYASLVDGIQEGVTRAATARNYPGGEA